MSHLLPTGVAPGGENEIVTTLSCEYANHRRSQFTSCFAFRNHRGRDARREQTRTSALLPWISSIATAEQVYHLLPTGVPPGGGS